MQLVDKGGLSLDEALTARLPEQRAAWSKVPSDSYSPTHLVFDGVGHLFTPVGTPDDGTPKPDPTIEAAAFAKLDAFLVSLGYMR
jgi:hypothetical protein